MAINYDAGGGNMGQLYTNLQNALSNKGAADNRKEARDIDRKGLFGTGIKQSHLTDLSNLAIRGAQLGDARMGQKMDRATKSFDRRMAADERRLKTLQQRWKTADPESRAQIMGEMEGVEMGMSEKRNSFEDYMGKYQEKGLWGTSFGGDDVGYRTEGESKWSQAVKQKLTSGDTPGGGSGDGGFTTSNFGGGRQMGIGGNESNAPGGLPPMSDFGRSDSQPGTDQEFRGGSNIGEGNEPNEYEEKFGEPPGMMNLGGIEAKDQTSPSMTPHRRFPSYMEQFPKKKDNLVGISNKFTGDTPKRDNYRRALPDALAQAGLSTEELAARDAEEKQELLKDKYLVDTKKQEYKNLTDKTLAKRKSNLITEALRETDWK